MRRCRAHRPDDLRPTFPVGADEAAFLVHGLLDRTPAAGVAVVWLDAGHDLLDLFTVEATVADVDDIAGVVLEPWSPVRALVLGSRHAGPGPPGDDLQQRWQALRARFDAGSAILGGETARVDLLDWFVVGGEVLWSLAELSGSPSRWRRGPRRDPGP